MILATHSVQIIFGLGETGLSCAEYLNDRTMPFIAMDSRNVAPYSKKICELKYCQLLLSGNPDQHMAAMVQYLENVEKIIVSPGVPRTGAFFDLVKQLKINIIGDIELFAQEAKAPVIAITGSNGKSTVTQLTTELLKASGKKVLVGGNIGIPALNLLKEETPDFYVLELSSFQLETTQTLRPIAGTVLNLSVDHLDRYASYADYCAVKMSLLENCENLVINKDEFPEIEKDAERRVITISINKDTDYSRQQQSDMTYWITHGQQQLLNQDELKIAGLHNISNAMSALALCEAAGVSSNEAMITVLKQWPGLEHRCQYIGEKDGIRCYNDSKATNVGSTIAALAGLSETISGKLILIAGGDGKGADFSPLASAFKRYLRALVLIGKDAERLLEEAGSGLNFAIVDDMKQAVATAFDFAKTGDAIVLSPACASFDMYNNFEQRGNIFCQEVEALL